MQTNKQTFWLLLCSLLFLRVIVGMHFFHEGVTKIRSGNFTCAPFLNLAKGPLASNFRQLLDDHDGRLRLCINEDNRIDTAQTFAIWDDFVGTSSAAANFSSEQQKLGDQALAQAKSWLAGFLAGNEAEILAWIAGEQRLSGFARDGTDRMAAAAEVASLNEQIEMIKYDRSKTAAPWFREVESTWDELESRINEIAGIQKVNERLVVSRPYDQPWSKQDVIDRLLPWFDTMVGALLVLGLFTRFAALAGIGLLLGVVATQPFWVFGAQNTYYQWIEIAVLLVLFAAAAGRFGGLDYFLERRKAPTFNEA